MKILAKKYWYGSTPGVTLLFLESGFFLRDIRRGTHFEDFSPEKSADWSTYQTYAPIFWLCRC